jgi:hypothetical protein
MNVKEHCYKILHESIFPCSLKALEFYNNLWGLGPRVGNECRTGPPAYVTRRAR